LFRRIIDCLAHEKAVAWGETGLDFEKNHSDPEQQKIAFKRQIVGAATLKKPLVVHSRKAADETFEIMKDLLPHDHRVHVHCFSDTVKDAERLLNSFPHVVRAIV
jgi:TatD DNase family protein